MSFRNTAALVAQLHQIRRLESGSESTSSETPAPTDVALPTPAILRNSQVMAAMNQGIGPRRTDTGPPCYKGNRCRTRPFGFPTRLGLDGPQEIHAVTL